MSREPRLEPIRVRLGLRKACPGSSGRPAKSSAITDYRANDKHDPEYYARHTVQKALAGLQQRFAGENGANERPTREIDRGDLP